VTDITEAASVLLARGPGSAEVFAVHRSPALRFFGGFHAFPGGKVHADDPATAARFLADPGEAASPLDVRRATVARELFEECGVLLARRPDGSFPAAGLAPLRRELVEDRVAFAEVLRRLGLRLRREDFAFAGTLVTPPFTALRFDTAFFVAELPPGQRAEVWPGELDEGRWTTGAALLDEWNRGACLVSPPTVTLLEAVRGRPVADLPARLAPLVRSLEAGAVPPIFFAPGVQMIPLRTVALPPSTHTNAYLAGTGPRYLIDPGPADADEQQRLFALLDAEQAAGRDLTAVVLTHHHPDHVGAAAACAARSGVPVWAHPWTAQALAGRVPVSREVHEGDRLDLGTAPDGSRPWQLEALLKFSFRTVAGLSLGDGGAGSDVQEVRRPLDSPAAGAHADGAGMGPAAAEALVAGVGAGDVGPAANPLNGPAHDARVNPLAGGQFLDRDALGTQGAGLGHVLLGEFGEAVATAARERAVPDGVRHVGGVGIPA
jgi:8-oxo-dGTP pyrophosphatase MutT (NUDIX family)